MIVQQILQFFEMCATWPVLPASVLMLLVVLYSGLVLLGAVDFELFDFDFDVDVDADANAATSIGYVSLKFLNIGEVPLMIWLSAFGFLWWVLSIIFWLVLDSPPGGAEGGAAAWMVVRNVAISLLLTKGATQPLVKVFAKQASRKPKDLIGQECEISTYDATPDAGQARYHTDAAPLLLNVRTCGETMRRGEVAQIIDYDSTTKLYLVAKRLSDQ